MPFIEHGKKDGIQWTIEGKEAVDKRFFALVTVGKVKKITDNTYRTEEGARDAGTYLKDKIIANMRGE
jgi:hypothetical protein